MIKLEPRIGELPSQGFDLYFEHLAVKELTTIQVYRALTRQCPEPWKGFDGDVDTGSDITR